MKINLFKIIIATSILLTAISIYLFSMNGRYFMNADKNAVLDTRTGIFYTAGSEHDFINKK